MNKKAEDLIVDTFNQQNDVNRTLKEMVAMLNQRVDNVEETLMDALTLIKTISNQKKGETDDRQVCTG